MKILKTIIAALLLFLPAASYAFNTQATAFAAPDASEPTLFILCLNNGEQVTFLLEHNPKVINGDGFITVVDADVTIEYPLDDVHKYLMGGDAATGIENIKVAQGVSAGEINNQAGNVMLSGFGAAVPVTVTDINGMAVYSSATDADGYHVIAMSQYPSGIYIVKVQNKTFKFIKR